MEEESYEPSDSTDDESFDLDKYEPTQEEDDEMLNDLVSTFWPGTSEYHCTKCYDIAMEPIFSGRDRYVQQHPIGVSVEAVGEPSTASETDTDTAVTKEMPNPAAEQDTPRSAVPADEGRNKTGTNEEEKQKTIKDTRVKTPKRGRKRGEGQQRGVKRPASVDNHRGRKKAANTDEGGAENVPESADKETSQKQPVPKEQFLWLPPHGCWGSRRSLFSKEEQAKYVAMLLNLQNIGKFRFQGNVADYQTMNERLKGECEKFNEFVSHGNRTAILQANNYLPRNLAKYALECLEAKASSVVQQLPRHFTVKGIHYITTSRDDHPELKLSRHLLDVGKPPRIVLPDITRKATVSLDNVTKIDTKFPANEKGKEGLVNNDENVERLIQEHGPDFVANASAIRSLITWSGPFMAPIFEVPVIVKPVYFQGQRQKVVYLNKPLPSTRLAPRQQLARMAKYSFKTDFETLPAEDQRGHSAAAGKHKGLRQYLQWTLKEHQIIIRSNVDGMCARLGSNRPRDSESRASVSVKVEYQPNHGAEEQTDEEVVYDWLTAFLKDSEVHIRARIKHDREYDILALDVLTRQNHLGVSALDVAPKQLITNGMRRLNLMLSELKNLNEGAYLVQIESSEAAKYTVFQEGGTECDEFNSSADIDLREQYNPDTNWFRLEKYTKFDQCWRKIDSNVVLQWHRFLKRMPTTFPPKKDDELADVDGEKDTVEVPKKKKKPGPKKGWKKKRGGKR